MRILAEPAVHLNPSAFDEVVQLYRSVGWEAYSERPALLSRALAGSHLVLTARQDTGELLGLARTVSDGETICYLQDLLVHPDARRRGVGRRLTERVLEHYRQVRQFYLTTDDLSAHGAAGVHAFYRSLGLVTHQDQRLTAFGRPG